MDFDMKSQLTKSVDNISSKKASSSKHCCCYSARGGTAPLSSGHKAMMNLSVLNCHGSSRKHYWRTGACKTTEKQNYSV